MGGPIAHPDFKMISRNEFRLMTDRVKDAGSSQDKRLEAALRGEDIRQEAELHDQVEAFLRRNDIPYVHSRMDKPSTIRKGWPDFTAMRKGRVACVELKGPHGKLSDDQKEVIIELQGAGVPVEVCDNLMKATKFLIKNLIEENPLWRQINEKDARIAWLENELARVNFDASQIIGTLKERLSGMEEALRSKQTLRDCESFIGACRFAGEGGLEKLKSDAAKLYKQISELLG